MIHHSDHCSCGDTRDHAIAKRVTADGKTFYIWSDGTMTWGDVGRTMIKGIGRARYAYARKRNLQIALALGDIMLDAAEIVPAFRAGQKYLASAGAWAADVAALRRAMLEGIRS